jgi:hypothetical protein
MSRGQGLFSSPFSLLHPASFLVYCWGFINTGWKNEWQLIPWSQFINL